MLETITFGNKEAVTIMKADMTKADEQSSQEWQAMFASEEDRNQKLSTLKDFFGPVADTNKTAAESFDPLAA